MKRVLWAVGLGMAAALCAGAWGEMTREQTKQAEGLIKQFTAAEFKTREEAVRRLVEMGPEVLGLVEKAKGEAKDAEVKLRCEMVMKGIEEKYGVTPGGLELERELKLSGTRVTIKANEEPLGEVLKSLSEQSGNRLVTTREEGLLGEPVTVNMKNVPYWEGLDKVCEAAGLSYKLYTDRVEVQGKQEGDEDIGASTGPFVVKLYSCRRSASSTTTRKFRPYPNEEGLKTENDSKVTMSFEYAFEDRVPRQVEGIRIESVRDEEGKELLAGREGEGAGGRLQWYGRGNAEWRDETPGREKRVTVSGTGEIEVAVGVQEVRMPDIFAKEPKAAKGAGCTFTVKSASREGRGITVVVEVERPAGTHIAHHALRRREYGFVLVSESGKRYDRLNSYVIKGENTGNYNASGDDLSFHVPASTSARPGQTETLTMKMGFAETGDEDGSLTLLYDAPERQQRRTYPFTIKDIRLP